MIGVLDLGYIVCRALNHSVVPSTIQFSLVQMLALTLQKLILTTALTASMQALTNLAFDLVYQ